MSIQVHFVMFMWVPFVVYMFSMKDPREASLICFISAWLFLPNAEYQLSGLPEYNKVSATCYGIVLSACLFDRNNILKWRPQWYDLPMIIFCISPLFSSLSNGLGLYDGLSCSLGQTVTWGLPYFIGRYYFSDRRTIRKLMEFIIIGGLLYVPLCLIEVRVSPQLHKWVYGYHVADFGQSIRYGGYRPTVFMEHGLMVGMWMATALLSAVVYAYQKKSILWFKTRKKSIVAVFLVTLVLIKSTGAIILFVYAFMAVYSVQQFKTKVVVILLLLMPLFYLGGRTFSDWDPNILVQWAEKSINKERAQSLAFRIENEEMIVNKAKLRPIFGWADWGRWRIYNDDGEDITISDSLWAIIFGRNGYVGLFSLYIVLMSPLVIMIFKQSANKWFNNNNYPYSLMALLCALYAMDCLMNAMINPFFALCAGAVMNYNMYLNPVKKEKRQSSLKLKTT